MALLRSKLFQNQLPNTSSSTSASSESDAQHWKQKAKERKQELLRLKEELKEAEVRLKKRKRRRTSGSIHQLPISDLHDEDVTEQLSASVDFLVELCETVSPVEEAQFANRSHQAVDFIIASLKKLLSVGNNMETIEGIISSLRLVKRMCTRLQGNCIMMAFIPSESYVGQQAILSVSERISILAESLLFMDPFDDAFPTMHNCMFLMIQLAEFLASDYLLTWSEDDGFDNRELAKLVGQASSLQKLNPYVRENLFR